VNQLLVVSLDIDVVYSFSMELHRPISLEEILALRALAEHRDEGVSRQRGRAEFP
jgi:hypothetical protein